MHKQLTLAATTAALMLGCSGATDSDEAVAEAYRSAALLTLVEDVRFCADEEVRGCLLTEMTFTNSLSDGGVIIGVPTGPITRFDASGGRVAEYGRAGGGPGEYRMVFGANEEPDGRIVLHDFGGSRRVVFSTDGAPLVTHLDTPDPGVRDIGLSPRGFAVLREPPAAMGDSIRAEIVLIRDTLPPKVVGELDLVRTSDEMGRQVTHFFQHRPQWAIESESSAIVVMGPTLKITRHFADGSSAEVTSSVALGNRRVTSEDILRLREQWLSNAPPSPEYRQSVAAMEAGAAEYHQFARGIRALRDGAFLLRESEVVSDSVRWTMFEAEGEIVGQIRLPGAADVVDGARDRLLIQSPDSRDVPVVAWYRVGR